MWKSWEKLTRFRQKIKAITGFESCLHSMFAQSPRPISLYTNRPSSRLSPEGLFLLTLVLPVIALRKILLHSFSGLQFVTLTGILFGNCAKEKQVMFIGVYTNSCAKPKIISEPLANWYQYRSSCMLRKGIHVFGKVDENHLKVLYVQ